MGDPKIQRKKYNPPLHPWQGDRIAEEKVLVDNYGLKNKKELWKMDAILRKIKRQTKDFLSKKGMAQTEAESKLFLEKLAKMCLISPTAKIEDVLDLHLKDILERRLQTQMMRKGLAKTAGQSRQFIIHGHVLVNGKKMDVPSYLVSKEEENKITFAQNSALIDAEHPARAVKGKEVPLKKEEKEDDAEEKTKDGEE